MKKSSFYLAALAAVAVSAPLSAQSVSSELGTVAMTNGPIQSAVKVYEMTGLKLTAFWSDETSVTTFLGHISGTTYGFNHDYLTMSLHGWSDTYYGVWSLNNRRSTGVLTGLLFEAGNTNVMFDRSIGFLGMAEGTPGSDVGYDYNSGGCTFLGLVLCDLGGHVVYSDAVALNGFDPQMDVFRSMMVTFGSNGVGASAKHDAFMRFDTDISQSGFWTPTPDPISVPEPASFALVAFGLAGLGAAARRRQRNA